MLEVLESRLVPCVDGLSPHLADDGGHHDAHAELGTFPAANGPAPAGATSTATGAVAGAGPAVPAYSSMPGAQATLYLNFSGDYVATWHQYSNITIPAFDTNGDPTTFSSSELTAIYQIWSYVAEDYAPFNVNVTTVDPRTVAGFSGRVSQIDIGGNSSWTGGTYGGLAQVGGLGTSSASSPVRGFVFPGNLGNNPKSIGEATSHESGHNFGLQHQSVYSGSTRTTEYYRGPGDGTAPIMGVSYSATRGLWWYGTPSNSSSSYQNDMAKIAGNASVGYRADDHGNTRAAADPLTVSGTQVSGSGLIGLTTDVDYFSFASGPGTVTFSVTTPNPYGNLAPRLELRDAGGTLLASAAPNASFGASVTTVLPSAGTYYVVVASNGPSAGSTATSYGFNVGTYTLSGTTATPTSSVSAPTNLTASAGGSTDRVTLNWTDNATNETGYTIERSSNGGATWTALVGLGADSTGYTDDSVVAGTAYTYRVVAFNATASSAYSATATATTVPLAPTSLTATAVSSSQVNLSWQDVAGETGYAVERSTDGLNWTQVGTTGVNVTSFQVTGLTASTTYSFRVRALNAGGTSDSSNQASATTPVAPALPAAPSNLTGTATSFTTVALSWRDNAGNETGYVIERSNNGTTWVEVGRTGANATSFTDATASPRRTYAYRVRAYNEAGVSAPSNTVMVTTYKAGGFSLPFAGSFGAGTTWTNSQATPVKPVSASGGEASPVGQAAAARQQFATAAERFGGDLLITGVWEADEWWWLANRRGR